jgi:hypothetical protein
VASPLVPTGSLVVEFLLVTLIRGDEHQGILIRLLMRLFTPLTFLGVLGWASSLKPGQARPSQAQPSPAHSVASAIAGVFANFPNKIAKITGKFEHVDKAKSRGVFCQH